MTDLPNNIQLMMIENWSVFYLDTEMVFRDEFDGLSILDVSKNLSRRTLVPNKTFNDLNAMYHGVSANQKYVWLAHDYFKVNLSSILSCNLIFSIKNSSNLHYLIIYVLPLFLIFRTFDRHSGLGIQYMKSRPGKLLS